MEQVCVDDADHGILREKFEVSGGRNQWVEHMVNA